ncbi:TIGR02677 family protein, partial [Streptomyces diastaticus]
FGLDAAWSEDVDLGIRLTVHRTEGARTLLRSADGDLLLDDLELAVRRTAVSVEGAEPTGSEALPKRSHGGSLGGSGR